MVRSIMIGAPTGIVFGLGIAILLGWVPIPPCEHVSYIINSDVGLQTWTVRQGVCMLTFNGQELLPWISRRWALAFTLIVLSMGSFLSMMRRNVQQGETPTPPAPTQGGE